MRLLPISKATLDTFRKDVYRPRLALLLLLILLSGRGAEQLGASRGSGSHAEQSAAALQIGQAEHKSARSGLTAILSTGK